MFPVLSLAVPPDLLVRLITELARRGDTRDPGELAVALLADWARAAPDAAARPGGPAAPPTGPARDTGGYRWKELFLPDGSQLRGDGGRVAYVRGGVLEYQGRPTSPNRFSGGSNWTSHNAWKAITIRRPGDPGWTRAWRLRQEARGTLPPRRVMPDSPPWQAPLPAARAQAETRSR